MNWIKPLHKWLSLLVGVQLFIWLGTGLYFNLADHQAASGNGLRQAVSASQTDTLPQLIPISELPVNKAEQVKLLWIQRRPFYQVIHQSQSHAKQPQQSSLYSATTGAPTALSGERLTGIALASYTGEADIAGTRRLSPPIDDLPGHQNPVWQVTFDDALTTSVYINPANGQVLKHVNDDSRLWDLMLMLHFMDYTAAGGFNSPWIQAMALATLFLAGSGLFWLVEILARTKPWRRRSSPTVVVDKTGRILFKGSVSRQRTVLEGLAAQGLQLPSICGGGGSCGQCLIKVQTKAPITPAEKHMLSQRKLARGFRLGCQHSTGEFETIELVNYTDTA